MNARVRWTSGLQFRGTAESGPTITLDAAPEHGGGGGGPSPMEAVLLALGGCTGLDVVSILKRKSKRRRHDAISSMIVGSVFEIRRMPPL